MEFDLKEVFSIFDENNEGQIQLRRFVDIANNYYSDAEVSTTVQQIEKKTIGEFLFFFFFFRKRTKHKSIFKHLGVSFYFFF